MKIEVLSIKNQNITYNDIKNNKNQKLIDYNMERWYYDCGGA